MRDWYDKQTIGLLPELSICLPPPRESCRADGR